MNMKYTPSSSRKKGFTLVELLLVLAVSMGISFLSFQKLVQDSDNTLAKVAGQQISQLGEAVNSYISVHYDTLSTLTNSTGSSTDPGPRTCVAGNNSCTITIATLVNEGLLPSTYGSTNIFKSPYTIFLKRSGVAPYYNVTGMITTSNPWIGSNNSIRYDLLGRAMQEAGIDSGMTRLSTTQMNGYNGNWIQTNATYSNITQLGQLGYQVGYGTYSYSIYLRRDGTLPMTGALNMGAQDINNAKNITASGKGIFGGEVTATNGYGDKITIGGDAVSNDYEIRLGTGKTLTIYSPNAAANSTVLSVGGNTAVSGRISASGFDPNDIPTGWGGGLRTFDVVASGTIALIKSGTPASAGNLAAYMNLNGDIYSSNTINTSGTMYASNGISTGGSISASGNVSGNGIYGNYVQSNGSMYSAGQISTASNISASGNISGNGIYGNYLQSNGSIYSAGATTSNGRLTANEYFQLNGVAYVGNGCGPNGVMGRTVSGQLVSCVNGVWRSPVSTSIYYNSAQGAAFRFPSATAYCNGNDIAVGGGGYCTAPSGFIWITSTYPVGTNGWYVSCDQNNKDPVSYVTTYVKCQASN